MIYSWGRDELCYCYFESLVSTGIFVLFIWAASYPNMGNFSLPYIPTVYFRIPEAFSLYSVRTFWVGELSGKLYFKSPCLVEDTTVYIAKTNNASERRFLCLGSILHSYFSNKYTVLKTSTLAGWKKDNIRDSNPTFIQLHFMQVCIEHCSRKVVFFFHKSTEYSMTLF